MGRGGLGAARVRDGAVQLRGWPSGAVSDAGREVWELPGEPGLFVVAVLCLNIILKLRFW